MSTAAPSPSATDSQATSVAVTQRGQAPSTDPAVRAGRLARRVQLTADVALAGRLLSPSWPLQTFIAVNPLGGLEDRQFGEAVQLAGELRGARGTLAETEMRAHHRAGRIGDRDLLAALRRRFPGRLDAELDVGTTRVPAGELLLEDLLHGTPAPAPTQTVHTRAQLRPDVARLVDSATSRWCAAFLDVGQAGWSMPGADQGFYSAWRALAPRDRALPRPARAVLSALPERADDAVLDALDGLGIGPGEQRAQLQAELLAMPGWASHVRWRAENGVGIDLVAYLALRLATTHALLAGQDTPVPAPPAPPVRTPTKARAEAMLARRGVTAGPGQLEELVRLLGQLPEQDRALVWQEAFEGHYRDDLLRQLTRPPQSSGERPAAQLVTCIDVRSEGLRRHLEDVGPYGTLGFAGFFAVAIAWTDLDGGASSALCPVLLSPRNAVSEAAAPGAQRRADRRRSGLQALAGAEQGFHEAKDDLAGPFALAEASGWFAGPLAAAKTVAAGPYGRLRDRLRHAAAPDVETTVDALSGFSPEERAGFAQVALRMMGLASNFARLVVLCGHGSTTENNPYGSSLDCGACGGSRGGPNARTAAALLNAADVREALRQDDIDVPQDTWFVAAEHDTATDQVHLLDRHLVPASHVADLDRLATDLGRAGQALAAERCVVLPGAKSDRRSGAHVRARSTDWAQVYPEWGLAGCGAFIVGPRSMTSGLDLERRTFLHSYEAEVDRDGSALETILTAPLVVAQWIACQYYFSSVDPQAFGAGSKTIHNVVGGVGVLAGHDGDLQLGLPWQSVGVGDRLVHEPMRLLAVVQAPLERIDDIVARNPILQRLFGNGWVALAARSGPQNAWQRHTRDGWTPWTTGSPDHDKEPRA